MAVAAAGGEAADILVLGIGNMLLGDEGLGVHAVARLQERFALPDAVAVVDGGTSGLDLLDLMAHRRHVIIVDAVAHGSEPGALVRLTDGEIPAFLQMKISPHQLGLADLLAVLQITGEQPSGLTLFGLQPETMDLGLDLSRCLSQRLDGLVDAVVAELAMLGQAVQPRGCGVTDITTPSTQASSAAP